MVRSSTGKKPIVAPYSGAMLAMVARSGTARLSVPAPKNSTNLPTTLCLRSSSVTVSTRSVAVTPSRRRPVNSKPTTSGVRKYTGWPSMPASASMPPTPQRDHADAVDHRGVAVGADQRVGVVDAVARLVHAARQVLQVDLVHDAEARRHDAEGVERLHAPLHELVALAVALELELHVEVERVLACRSGRPSPSGRPPGPPAPAARSPWGRARPARRRCASRPGRPAAARR